MVYPQPCSDSNCSFCRCPVCSKYKTDCDNPFHSTHTWLWIRRQEKIFRLFIILKKLEEASSQLWTSCFSELIRDPRSLFYRKGQSWLYKKQDSLPNRNQSFLTFQSGSIDGIRSPKWHLQKRMSVCSNLVISIFKSKLLVLFILRM